MQFDNRWRSAKDVSVLVSVGLLVIEFIDRNRSSLRETNSSSFDMLGQKNNNNNLLLIDAKLQP